MASERPFEDLAKQIKAIKTAYGKIDWDKPDAGIAASDIVSDSIIPLLEKLISVNEKFAEYAQEYLGEHEERLSEIEAGNSSLSQEDADTIMEFVGPALEYFKAFLASGQAQKEAKSAVTKLIESGEEAVELIESLIPDEEDDEGEDEDS
jgi:hypothetical protein